MFGLWCSSEPYFPPSSGLNQPMYTECNADFSQWAWYPVRKEAKDSSI